jgi:hypothetical protein
LLARLVRTVALAVLVSALAAPAFAWTNPKLDPLLSNAASLLFGQSRVVVTAKDHVSLDAVAWLIQVLGGSLGPQLPIINAQAATVPNLVLRTLTLSNLVRRVSLDRPVLGVMERTGHTV